MLLRQCLRHFWEHVAQKFREVICDQACSGDFSIFLLVKVEHMTKNCPLVEELVSSDAHIWLFHLFLDHFLTRFGQTKGINGSLLSLSPLPALISWCRSYCELLRPSQIVMHRCYSFVLGNFVFFFTLIMGFFVSAATLLKIFVVRRCTRLHSNLIT